MNSRLSFYSCEGKGEMLLHIPASLTARHLTVILRSETKDILSWKGYPGKKILRLPVEISGVPGNYRYLAEITSGSGSKFRAEALLTILSYKPNEVKTDRLTGGLICGNRIFFPFGFYCYSPVYPALPEEEVVKGFNMISPYQRILPSTLAQRKEYMDRCAELGMKVHYNLISVSGGGGGVGSAIDEMTDAQKKSLLVEEIKTFMDHPALLGWYIADEPDGFKVPPEKLLEIYRTVRETDPWHPVSVVFMAPYLSSKKYADALDIVMADPYPVPNSSISLTGDAASRLRAEFEGRKPVWIVPQAFGGSELWAREPSLQEIRSMTYQAIINGARGIQYFVRQGPNLFPKSTATWNECGRMALEIAEITPWLLSDEEANKVTSFPGSIQVLSALHDGQLIVVAVNTSNSPQRTVFRVAGIKGKSARVLFENRSLPVNSGQFSDYLSAYGSQVYLISPEKETTSTSTYRGNLIRDPGFEDISSPGVPASCYAWTEGDRGATYFVDSREHFEGNHSLRLTTPKENMGCRLRFYPVKISKGKTYMLSVRAKTDTAQLSDANPVKPYFELGLGEYGNKRFTPGNDWQEYLMRVTIPSDSIASKKANVLLRMPGKGVVWFDMLQLFEAEDINRSINPEAGNATSEYNPFLK